jgi:hypothetical protein
VLEKVQHGSQKVISELQAMQDLCDPEVAAQRYEKAAQDLQELAELQRMASGLQHVKSGPKMERSMSHQSG